MQVFDATLQTRVYFCFSCNPLPLCYILDDKEDSIYESKQQTANVKTAAEILWNEEPDLLAAKKILQKQGYDALSIKNICEEAGVSNGSFYHHLRQKMTCFHII